MSNKQKHESNIFEAVLFIFVQIMFVLPLGIYNSKNVSKIADKVNLFIDYSGLKKLNCCNRGKVKLRKRKSAYDYSNFKS